MMVTGAGARADTVTVHVVDFEFVPDPVITLGTTIHWVWDSGFHSATSVAGIPEVFDSGDHLPPFFFDHTFTHAGDWEYFCDVHGFDGGDTHAGGMAGVIHVIPAPSLTVALACIGIANRRRRR